MVYRCSIGAAALIAVLCIQIAGAKAEDEKKYPNWDGLWKRGSPVGVSDPTKPPGLGQQPRGPRLFDSTGIPTHADNETTVTEKLYLDKKDPDILRNEITTYDHALTRPWTVSRFYRREHNPNYQEYPCTEDNRWITIGGELYLADSDGCLMPIQKNQPPPDPKYLEKYFKQPQR